LTSIVGIYQGFQRANILVNLGCYKNAVGKGYDAMNDFDNSLKILKNNNDPISLAISHNNKAVVELKSKHFKEAFSSAKSAITLVEPIIFEKIKHFSEASLKEQKPFQDKLHVLLIAYKNFSIIQKKMNNHKYAKTVYDHCIKMANKLCAPGSKFIEIINMSSSSDTVRNNKRNIKHASAEKPNQVRPFTSQSNATSKLELSSV